MNAAGIVKISGTIMIRHGPYNPVGQREEVSDGKGTVARRQVEYSKSRTAIGTFYIYGGPSADLLDFLPGSTFMLEESGSCVPESQYLFVSKDSGEHMEYRFRR